jgi:glycine amidinotransferase
VTPPAAGPPVGSHNEWDPLEEVIVGVLEGACDPPWEAGIEATWPVALAEEARLEALCHGGKLVAESRRVAAQAELDRFVDILTAEGITVRRPDPLDQSRGYATPDWQSVSGYAQANPRDVLVVIGDEILEATMSWRSRYFEVLSYRRLIKEYFRRGARWTAAPKPQLENRLYRSDYRRGEEYVTAELEPVFDAADIARCGRDLFVQRSHVTNDFGIEWLRRHLGSDYRVHRVEFRDDRAVHIDATFVPLAPGKLLVNPDRPMKQVPEVLRRGGWELLPAPPSTLPRSFPMYESCRWLSVNVLSLDERRVIVEEREEPLIRALRDWGFEPIPCPFRENYLFGGGFHCATVDIRRRGSLQSYF